ncbi:hypothetical protein [Legionella fallonii]|uniref:Uncharacterized protein n=1 Tax=Legionella fallonii LLAP-10 TaxID=1212491 RepID=A0A098GAP5_9GAMM|nr:hypothetical protein [Legionella fallonii]CEG58555.1 protein of unknown function [Legionella fallonii LLAP-10]
MQRISLSQRQLEEQRLRIEANGTLAPAKPGSVFETRRKNLIEKRVQEGLQKFDEEQNESTELTSTMQTMKL